jgi:DNA-binding XRE family transcriptional regulator
MGDYYMIVNRLKVIRMREYMLSQQEFAEMLGIARNQYNRYEKQAGAPSLEIALKIANKLNKDIRDIFTLVN